MTVNVIIASVFTAAQQAVAIKRAQVDSISEGTTDWREQAEAILAGIPASAEVGLLDYLKTSKAYPEDELAAVGILISTLVSPKLYEIIIDGGSLDDFTSGAKPDADIVNHIIKGLNLKPVTTPVAGETMTATPTSTITFAPGMEQAINSILSPATGGKVTDIGKVFADKAATEAALELTKAELTTALTKLRTPVIPTTGSVAGPTGPLTYELVNVPANVVFTHADGKATGKNFVFEVPTLIWKDASGAVVQHPECPPVDTNYDFNGVKLLQFLTATTRNMNTWLYGHTGTGKTTFIEQVAARLGWPCIRINLDANLERADIVGHVALTEKGGTTVTQFEEGILPYAMQRPGFLIMDEIDAGRPDILFSVQKALESKGLTLTEDNHRVIQPHPLFRFAATANTRGQGDEYGMYQGVRAMNASLIDRFSAFIGFDYMKPDRESALLQKLVPGLPAGLSDKLAQFASEVRNAFGKGEVYTTVSPRGLTAMADSFATFVGMGTKDEVALQMAMDMTILGKVTNDTRQKYVELATRCFGKTVR